MIRISQACKRYVMGTQRIDVLREVDFSVERGEFVAIVGASGSGKSTLLYLIGCLDTLDEGSYRFEGADITHARDNELAHLRCTRMGFVFQGFHLVEQLTARQNIEQPMLYRGVAASQRRTRALELLQRLDLAERADHHPTQLSGGQQQRVAFARALANDPDLIIADEPTGNLDSAATEAILSMLGELKRQGKTIILVTHDRHVAACADRQVVMHDGRLSSLQAAS